MLSCGGRNGRSRFNLSPCCDAFRFRFGLGLGARRRSRPFQTYRLTIGGLTVGQAKLGNEGGGTDKIFRWSNPSVLEIAGGQLPRVGGDRAPS
jgi:hypothetical protein